MALREGLVQGLKATTKVTYDKDGVPFVDEYSSLCMKHAVTYRKNGKAIKTADVPEEVREQLYATMLIGAPKPEVIKEEVSIEPTPESIAVVEDVLKDEFGFSQEDAAPIDYPKLLEEAEARSVDTVNLRTLVETLYNRFGIYTVYLNRTPTRADVNPLTGAIMNSLTLGQANQGFRTAQRLGTSWNPEAIKSQISQARQQMTESQPLPVTDLQQEQVINSFEGQELNMPSLHGEPTRHFNRSFESPHKSAVNVFKGRESDGLDDDEMYAEPPINAGNSIVRAFISNKRTESQLGRISNQRSVPSAPVSFDDLV